MTARSRTMRLWALVAFVMFGVLFSQLEQIANRSSGNGGYEIYFAVVVTIAIGVMMWLGTTVVRRQPDNRIGWLFIALSTAVAVWDVATSLTTIGAGRGAAWVAWAAWAGKWSLVPVLVLFLPIFLLFPDGRSPSPRWRPVLWVWTVASVGATIAFALSPDPLLIAPERYVENPVGVAGPFMNILATVAGTALFLTMFATGTAVVVRFRRSRGEERAQLKWLVLVVAAFLLTFGTTLLITIAFPSFDRWMQEHEGFGNLLFTLYATILILGLPAACAVAILKYRLYDIDVVIRKAVVFGSLALFIGAAYALVVGGVGALVGSSGNTALSFAAAAALAIAFQPAQERARRFADRVVYGKRATPYEVLSSFSGQMADTYATEDVLSRMAEILGAGTGAERANVWLRVGAELRPAASWPDAARWTEVVQIHGDAVPDLGSAAVEVRHRGELLGALSVEMPPSDPMNPSKAVLVEDLASQAGLVLRNVRLIEELRASRQRLVAAQDEERRKLERNLHDGAQQQLVALAVQLKLARTLIERDPATATTMLEDLQGTAGEALEELRDLARGIYPPLLADRGLLAALEAQARKAAVPVTVRAHALGRYPREVESAVYFSSLEALNNVAKYAGASCAEVSLRQVDGNLMFEIHDDGNGFNTSSTDYGTGLQGMADRLDAVGGTLDVRSAPGEGTTVIGTLPAEAEAPA